MPSMMNRFSEPDDPSTWMPPERLSSCAPAAVETTDAKSRPFGIRSMTSWLTVVNEAACLTSMSGDSPVTWMVSATPATASVKSIFRNPPTLRMASDFAALKP
jgi:hypothetical protein